MEALIAEEIDLFPLHASQLDVMLFQTKADLIKAIKEGKGDASQENTAVAQTCGWVSDWQTNCWDLISQRAIGPPNRSNGLPLSSWIRGSMKTLMAAWTF